MKNNELNTKKNILRNPWVGTQLHFGQPFDLANPKKKVEVNDVINTFAKVKNKIKLDGVLVGFSTDPILYDESIKIIHELGAKAYLWYGVFADIGEDIKIPQDAYMVNFRGDINPSWGKIQSENFQFVCPNHQFIDDVVVPNTLQLVDKHGFDGIFLDRIRYPSFITGIDNQFCCFCEWCQKKAEKQALDLDKVKIRINQLLEKIKNLMDKELLNFGNKIRNSSLRQVVSSSSSLSKFYEFRENSVIAIVKKIYDKMHERKKEVGLDLFSPSLSPFVSQNYPLLSNFGDWIKTMSYCFGKGPAALPFEAGLLVEMLHQLNPKLSDEALEAFISDIIGTDIRLLWRDDKKIEPAIDILTAEMNKVHNIYNIKIPVYPGFEAVNLPGICDVGPSQMKQYGDAYQKLDLDGFILCWTLPLIADENIIKISQYVD